MTATGLPIRDAARISLRVAALCVAVALPAASVQAQEPWQRLYGSWQSDDGRILTIEPEGFVETGPDGWLHEGAVGTTPEGIEAGDCGAAFSKERGATLVEGYIAIRDFQIQSGATTPDPLPEALSELTAVGSYYVLTALCYEVRYEWVLVTPDRLLQFATGEGMIEPSRAYARQGDAAVPETGPPAIPDEDAYAATYRDWSVVCRSCVPTGQSQCSIRTPPTGTAPGDGDALVVYGDPGSGLAVGLPAVDGASGGTFALSVDGGEPATLAASADAGAETRVDDPQQVAVLVAAFRRGYSVSLTRWAMEGEGFQSSYSLLGFTAALEDVLRITSGEPPACSD